MTRQIKKPSLARSVFLLFVAGIILLLPAGAVALFNVKAGGATWMILMFLNIMSHLADKREKKEGGRATMRA